MGAHDKPGWDSRRNPIWRKANREPVHAKAVTLPEIHQPEPRIPRYASGCYGKVRYWTKAAAMLAAEEVDPRLVVYCCRWCGCWHIGHKR